MAELCGESELCSIFFFAFEVYYINSRYRMIQIVGLLHNPIVLYPQNKTTFI